MKLVVELNKAQKAELENIEQDAIEFVERLENFYFNRRDDVVYSSSL